MISQRTPELFEPGRLRCVETVLPVLSAAERLAMDERWAEAVLANPHLFDGPTVAGAGLDRDGPDGLVLTWARSTYRRRVLRRIPGAPRVSSVFVCVVQAADDGRLMVGRMAPWTASPGRLQLPGGSMEPPPPGEPLDLAALRRHAARELVEETGLGAPSEELTLWLVTRGENGSIGFHFRAPRRPAALLYERFAAMAAAERALGREPELERIALIRSEAGPAGLDGPRADYLGPVVRRHLRD
ncbi:NUDIX hydrolase [Streptomyces sp. NPDC059142]|uniref:NUDIX hydrolase n=1 Tax=Streptomyces sp. NPDC059142 TaxID=3346739 RepID=UPI0036BE19AC